MFKAHATRPKNFIILRRDQKGKVTFGDNISSKIIGKGTVAIREQNGKDENVLLLENLKPNLLSLIQTCDQGHICIFDYEKCEIRKRTQENLLGLL